MKARIAGVRSKDLDRPMEQQALCIFVVTDITVPLECFISKILYQT